MPGYNPLLLRLAPLTGSLATVGRPILHALDSNSAFPIDVDQSIYVLDSRAPGSPWSPVEATSTVDWGVILSTYKGVKFNAELTFDTLLVASEVTFTSVSPGEDLVEVRISFESPLYDGLFRWGVGSGEINPAVKECLVRFCTDIANAANALAFILDHAVYDAPVIQAHALVHSLCDGRGESRDSLGLISGVKESLIPTDCARTWDTHSTRYRLRAFAVMDLLQPVALL